MTTHLSDGCGNADGNERCRRSANRLLRVDETSARLLPRLRLEVPGSGHEPKGCSTRLRLRSNKIWWICAVVLRYIVCPVSPQVFPIHFSKCFLRAPYQTDKSRGRVWNLTPVCIFTCPSYRRSFGKSIINPKMFKVFCTLLIYDLHTGKILIYWL